VKKRVLDASFNFILKYQNCDELAKKKIKYGLEMLYNIITKLVVMLIISLILGIWKEYLLFTLIYAYTKKYTYGVHAKSSIACWLITLPVYLGGCYFIRYIQIPTPINYIIILISFIAFLLWAPADTPGRPLIHKEIRKKQKILACSICILYAIIISFFHSKLISNTIIYSLIVQIICINPLTYLLTKTPYANYKAYYKKHGLNF